MPYASEYRLQWTIPATIGLAGEDIPEAVIRCSIYDNENEADATTLYELQAGGEPLRISVIDNDEDKYKALRGKKAVMQFITNNSSGHNINTFADSSDNRWYVEITFNPDTDNLTIFKGFLVLADLEQPFLPDPQVITLTASDHLAVLSDIPFSEDDESVPIGKYRLAEVFALCLKKTGLSLPLNVINNVRHGTGQLTTPVTFTASTRTITMSNTAFFFYPGQSITVSGSSLNNGTYRVISSTETTVTVAESLTDELTPVAATFTDNSVGHLYDKLYVDAKTFESNINERESCKTVLEKILGEDCELFQYKGEWWIVRIDEYESNPFYRFIFDADGALLSSDTVDLSKEVGSTESFRLANANEIVRTSRPHRHIKETFNFQTPAETICNIDYTRGDETSDPDVTVAGYTAYELDDWDVKKDWGSNETTPDIKSSIQRTFTGFGDEDTRFIMLTYPSDYLQGSKNYIRSCPIPMGYLDKFRFSFDVSAMTNPSGDGTVPDICHILFYGASGIVYGLYPVDATAAWLNTDSPPDLTWKVTNAEYTLFRTGLSWAMFSGVDKRDWQSCTINGAPVPEEGELRIMLTGANKNSGGFDTFNIRYQNLSFEYAAYIGGRYTKYTGQYHSVTRDPVGGYSTKRENEVFISDSPRPLFKGGLFFASGSGYHLSSQFWSSAPFALGSPPDYTYRHRFGYIQAYSVWNQFRTGYRIFTGDVYGLGAGWIDMLHKVSLTDPDWNTNNRYFILLSLEQNWRTGIWNTTFAEVFRTDVPKSYGDTHLFKYLTDAGK